MAFNEKNITKIHVVGNPRSGGTAYSNQIARQCGYQFVNEPYNLRSLTNVTRIHETEFGGNISPTDYYVKHSLCSDYLIWRRKHFDKADKEYLIVLERKNKWEQLLSFCILATLRSIDDTHRVHNISINEKLSIEAPVHKIREMFYEWQLLQYLKSMAIHNEWNYYEDIEFQNTQYVKNKGYDNVSFTNIETVTNLYKSFWGTSSLECIHVI